MSRPVILRPAAEADVRRTCADYDAIDPDLGRQFSARVRERLEQIEFMPEMFGLVWQDVRAVRLKQFRQVVYYVVTATTVEVIAVIHGARHPNTWQSRV